MKKENLKILKTIVIILTVLIIILLCLRYAVPLTRLLVTEEGRAELCEWVEQFGFLAPVVFILLMALQIIIAFIPGGPLELVGGMLFGGKLGLLYTVLGALLGTMTVYGLVKRFGRPLVSVFVNEEKMKKYRFLHDEKKLEFWVFFLFLIPGIPKDMLTYIVPLTSMQGKQFILLATLARFPALAASVLVGDSLAEGRYRMCVIICAVIAVLVFLGYQLKNRIMKDKGDKT